MPFECAQDNPFLIKKSKIKSSFKNNSKLTVQINKQKNQLFKKQKPGFDRFLSKLDNFLIIRNLSQFKSKKNLLDLNATNAEKTA